MEAHADLLRGFDAVVELAAVRVDVQVVAGGGAAGEHQFAHRGEGGDVHHLGSEIGPDRVQVGEPAAQFAVLRGGDGARQALVHVMVGVDQARYHYMVGGVDYLVGGLREVLGGAYLGDHIVLDVECAVGDFAALVVRRGE